MKYDEFMLELYVAADLCGADRPTLRWCNPVVESIIFSGLLKYNLCFSIQAHIVLFLLHLFEGHR